MRINADEHGSFELESALVRIFASFCLVFVVCAFAENSFAQDSPVPKEAVDFLPLRIALERQIESGSAEEKREALRVIRNLETAEASRIALPALKDKSEIVRATAAASVVFLPPDEGARAILPLLADKNEFVRKEAAYALGKTRSASAIAPLAETLRKDKKLEVKSAAAVALGEIGDAAAVPVLTALLQTSRKADEEFLRRSAARAVGQIAQILQTGVVKVVTPENFISEKNRIARAPRRPRLIESFPVFRAANAVLIQTLQTRRATDDERREAAFALGSIGDESALAALRAAFDSEDYYLAQICREAVEKILKNQSVLDSAR